MKRFLTVISLFLLPVVLFYALLATVMYNTRELAEMDELIPATVSGELKLYGTGYHENFFTYKHRVTSELAPELLVLGTSRSMQISGDFFSEKSFYNAGGGVRNVANYSEFLQALPKESLPKTLLVVLDQDMFNTPWRQANFGGLSFGDLEMKPLDTLLRLGFSYGDGKFSILSTLLPKPGVYGLAASASGSGFATDGSYRYGKTAELNLQEPEKNFSSVYRNIDFNELRFQGCDTPDATALEQLDGFLSFCRENNIHVVGFLPPFPPAVITRMEAAGKYGYLDTLYSEIAARFEAAGGEFFDFTSMPDTQDVEYIDGFHGGDRVYGYIIRSLSEQSALLKPLIDRENTEALLAQPSENPRVLPFEN